MISAEQQHSWFQQLIEQGDPDLPGRNIPWLDQARERARQAVAGLPALDRRQEAWRYTRLDGLLEHRFQPLVDSAASLQSIDLQPWLLPDLDSHRLVFVNGRCAPRLSHMQSLPSGVYAGSLRAALTTDPELLASWFGHTANPAEHLFSALNSALMNDGLFIHVPPDIELQQPVEVIWLHTDHDHPASMQSRNLVVLEAGARATLIERFISTGPSLYFDNGVSELMVGEKASLTHYRIQDESRNAFHMHSLHLSQRGDSHYQGSTLAFGGAWARTDYKVRFHQPGADCHLSGLYSAGDRQLTDFHIDVEHGVPGCSSQTHFKGILHGEGRAVFDGRILVDRQAQQSDAHLTNHNLMLTRNAEVDTKPQLEIYTDDVKCSHGTTVGQLDPQQLFYLRSRGIDAEAAKRMLCSGFASDIIDAIGLEPLRRHGTERLLQTLDTALIEGHSEP